MPRVLVHTLVRIDAELACLGETKRAAGPQPLIHEVAHQPFAQLQFQHLVEPVWATLRPAGRGDDGEYEKLVEKAVEILSGQRVVKRLVPGVQLDLAIGGGRDDDNTSRR